VARLDKIARHSSHNAGTTLSLEDKVLATNKEVPDPINSYKIRYSIAQSKPYCSDVGCPRCVPARIERNGDYATVIYHRELDAPARRKP
jgi:hypothetical protein